MKKFIFLNIKYKMYFLLLPMNARDNGNNIELVNGAASDAPAPAPRMFRPAKDPSSAPGSRLGTAVIARAIEAGTPPRYPD